MKYPKKIFHWISNKETSSKKPAFFPKYDPATGRIIAKVAGGDRDEAEKSLRSAVLAFEKWSRVPVVKRAEILREAVILMGQKKEEIAEIVALESGKSKKDALLETLAAIECGFFFAGEGRRYFGEVLTSAVINREVKLIRQSIGVGALIPSFNNPIAGIAWKAFPALLCGNVVVVKSHEFTPYVAVWFAKVLKEAGVPSGVFSVLQGFGPKIGAPLVEDSRVKFVSFTGSVATGRKILQATSERLAKVSIEAGGKNPFVVCDDADLERAVNLAAAGAFVDAGQRCAATSRIIIFSKVYNEFKRLFLNKIAGLKVGVASTDDFGAIIEKKRLLKIFKSVKEATNRGATLLTGGKRLSDKDRKNGYFMAPTVLENISPKDPISYQELFGPVVILYKVKNFEEAVRLANDSEFKLTGAIHTSSIHRAQEFIQRYAAGVVRVNGPTHGSEPHMPFGGIGISGNGWREPGTKALDFYSNWKQVSIDHNPHRL